MNAWAGAGLPAGTGYITASREQGVNPVSRARSPFVLILAGRGVPHKGLCPPAGIARLDRT